MRKLDTLKILLNFSFSPRYKSHIVSAVHYVTKHLSSITV
jgi:hypothetical protein